MKNKFTLLFLWAAMLGLQAQQTMPGLPPPPGPMTAAERQAMIQKRMLARQRGATNNAAAVRPAATAASAAAATPAIPSFPNLPGATPSQMAGNTTMPASTTGTAPAAPEEMIPAKTINFQGVDVSQVLEVYAQLVNRTILRANLPEAKIVLKTQTPLTKTEAIQALQAVLALNGISVVNIGDKFVKVLQSDQATTAGAEFDHSSAENLPNLGSYVTHIVQLKYTKPSEVATIIQPFGKLQNSAVPFDNNGVLVLRDYAENVKRMLEIINQIDVNIPAEYTSEVIPIRYAQAADIASALNSLGGSGGTTVSFGTSGMSSSVSGMSGGRSGGGFGGSSGGFGGSSFGGSSGGGGFNGLNSGGGYGSQNRSSFGGSSSANPNGTPSTGTSFAQRLNNIVNAAASPGGAGGAGGNKQDAIQVFGQAKIIADQRSNALLVFATRSDMVNIKKVIDQLDVLLAQVLIEAVILDVSLNKAFNFSMSVAQNPVVNKNNTLAGAGGFNNSSGSPFLNFLNSTTNGYSIGTNTSSLFGNALPSGGGMNYFGNIGQTWDVALSALQSDSSANVIQKPRIQTSQAKAATFFVGQTVPYVTGTYYGGGYSGGNSSQYSQLSVGVELDVTPFINPDGLVVMDINQEIDDVNGYTQIDGNKVPTTTKRTLSSEIAVRDQDTIILGGFVRDDKSKAKSGVPLLSDIPLLGNLFTSRSDTKDREELLVLMRPTVLKTPEAASHQTIKEEQRLPGISSAQAEQAEYERTLIDAQRKLEKARAKKGHTDGYYNVTIPADAVDTNSIPVTNTVPVAVPVTNP